MTPSSGDESCEYVPLEYLLGELVTRGPIATLTEMLLGLGLSRSDIRAWFDAPLPDEQFGGRTPREVIADGQAAKLVVRLLSHRTPRVADRETPPTSESNTNE